MAPYRAHFINHGGYIFGTEAFEAESDQHAIDHAKKMFRTAIGKGHEIWQGERHVHTEIYPPSD